MFFFVAVLDHFPCSWDSCFNLNKIEGEKKKILIRCWGLVEQQTLNGGTAEEEIQVQCSITFQHCLVGNLIHVLLWV